MVAHLTASFTCTAQCCINSVAATNLSLFNIVVKESGKDGEPADQEIIISEN